MRHRLALGLLGKVDVSETALVTVILRPSPPSSGKKASALKEVSALLPNDRRYPTREEFAADYGATAEEFVKVEEFARDYGLGVAEENPARRSVVLSGTLGQFSLAFGVKLMRYKHPKGIFRGRSGPIYLPADLAPLVLAVLGLDDRPQAKSHLRILGKRASTGGAPYTPPQVAETLRLPSGPGRERAVARHNRARRRIHDR